MIRIKKSSTNLIPFTLRERGSAANQVLSNYIATGYINIGYFLGATVTSDDFVLEIKSKGTGDIKSLLLKGVDNATSMQDRYDLWVLNEVDLVDEDLTSYKINLNAGQYDYRIINDADEVVESGMMKVFSESSEDQYEVFTTSANDEATFVFK